MADPKTNFLETVAEEHLQTECPSYIPTHSSRALKDNIVPEGYCCHHVAMMAQKYCHNI